MNPTIRTQRPDERAAVREVITKAFHRTVVADLYEALCDAPAGAAGLSFVAEHDGQLVGHVMLTRSWLDAPHRLVEVLVLSPLSVVPEHQRRGVGARLVAHARRRAERAGAPLLFLEGSPDYYGRLGFRTASRLGFTAPSVRIPDPAFQVVMLPAYEPWMTGALVYAEQFWAFDCVGPGRSTN
ncbi:MAG TPA: N-acetyltransferase [Actinophytocola sp.]|uniref:GNAT family N-acetyltransferase n=1 Tax=Actinophytocola sp. TaxID=1872138 RepID=UPI002DDC9E5C|nr:N-acetyltransferase [Actinophytocola sp.]HEV2781563.1 N-acetyltransferase [Actinophytocola sp.]